MDTIQAIHARRAVKHFDPAHQMPEHDITTIFNAAIQSPSSFNLQHWRFVLVRDPATRRQIRAAAFDQAQVTDASLLVVVAADLMAWAKDPPRYWRDAPKQAQDILVPWITRAYEGNPQLQRDEAMRSMGIAAQTIMLAAKSIGYDSCPMIGFDFDAVARIINLPHDHAIGLMITIGKATKPAWPKPGQLPLNQVLIHERF